MSLWHQPGNRPRPLTSSVVTQMITNFSYFSLLFKVLKTIRYWVKREIVFVNVAKCKIQVYLFCLLFVFSFACSYWFIVIFVLLFSFLCNSGVYSFLLVFAPSLAFLCYFIFISAFVSSYSFYFLHVLAYFIFRSLSVQWVSAFWSALSAVLFSSLQLLLVSLFALFAVRFQAVLWPKQCKCSSQSSYFWFVIYLL